MAILIGTSGVNQILGLEQSMNSDRLHEFLKSNYGIDPIGEDSRGNRKWAKDKIEEVASRVKQSTVLDVHGDVDGVREAIQQIYVAVAEISEEVSVIKKQGQAINFLVTQQADAIGRLNAAEPNSFDVDADAMDGLRNSVTAYLSEQQRLLSNQLDNGLNSIDEKIEKNGASIKGQNSVIIEVKTALKDLLRISNNIISNTHAAQINTRDELIKRIGRVEMAIDSMAEQMKRLELT